MGPPPEDKSWMLKWSPTGLFVFCFAINAGMGVRRRRLDSEAESSLRGRVGCATYSAGLADPRFRAWLYAWDGAGIVAGQGQPGERRACSGSHRSNLYRDRDNPC